MPAALQNIANISEEGEVPLMDVSVQGHDINEHVIREQEIRRDVELASRMQKALLIEPPSSDYLQINTIYKPMGYIGGDIYFMDWGYKGNLLRGCLVEGNGHGISSALHTIFLHALLREVNELDLPLSESVCWMSRRMEFFDTGVFAGALVFEFDLETRQLRWVCTGKPQAYAATKTRRGDLSGKVRNLGIAESETFETHLISIDAGDSFYFMTKGLVEQLEEKQDLPLEQYPEMIGRFRALADSGVLKNDATAVCVHVKAMPRPLVRQDGWPQIFRFNGYADFSRFKGEVAKTMKEATGALHSIQEVAVHEALTNALECRDGVVRQQKACLRINKIGNRLIVRVKTSRIGFAGNAILRRLRSTPDKLFSFGEDASMGRGIPMMLSLSHKMAYNSEGTEVLLSWKL